MNRLILPTFLGVCSFLGGMVAIRLSSSTAHWAFARSGEDVARIEERFEAVARKVSPAVVALEAIKPTMEDGKIRSIDDSGSGSLVRFPGKTGIYVLTNHHVIGAAPARQITVNTGDGKILKPTRVWADPETDVAVMALSEEAGLTVLPLGDSDRAKVGHWVLAFGSPFGLHQTVTHGIISARSRGQVSLGSTIRIKDFLQTDAAINPGSSGGPLVNVDGELIGVNTAIASPSKASAGVAFAIPSNLVKLIAMELLERGRIVRGYLGVQLAAGLDLNEALKLGLSKAQGALVDAVQSDSPAFKAGLRRGDVILDMDTVPVMNDNQFINRVSGMTPGRKVQLRIWRDRESVTVEAVIGDWAGAKK
ncbi:MAG: PDZ domain-containing protein [Planctomycetia bacterium]|nr:PDZ domain-containing protein [Planctomycetia bacterium]